jgi:hypothetical protein
MLITVVNQTYTRGLAVDSSGMSNHGIPIDVTAGAPGFAFNQAGSRINIRPSNSLMSLGCIRAGVSFSLQPRDAAHRYNLAEGFESFALFVNPNLSLSGTIYDANENWTGATSPANTVTANKTHVAILECDGISMVRVLLDGTVVAENYNVAGTVRGVGSMGLAIGHWPNPPNQYTFEGTIFAALLQKYSPRDDAARFIDPCCYNRKAIANWFARMAKKGVSISQLTKASIALKATAATAAAAGRGGTKAGTVAQRALAAALVRAIQRRDPASLSFVLQQWQASAKEEIDSATRATLQANLQTALVAFGLDWFDWCELMKLFCLDPCGFKRCGSKQ